MSRRKIYLLITLVILIAITWAIRETGYITESAYINFKNEQPALAIFLFIVAYTFSVVAMIPTLPFNLLAGFLWGGFIGGLISAGASTLGACITFYIVRFSFADLLPENIFKKRKLTSLLEKDMSEKPMSYVAAVRLNPLFPTGVINYLFGLSKLNFKVYIVASAIFFLPGGFAFAIVGAELGVLIKFAEKQEILYSILILFFAVSMLLTGYIFSKLIAGRNKFNSVSEIENENA